MCRRPPSGAAASVSVERGATTVPACIPWSTPPLWAEANLGVARVLRRRRRTMAEARFLARGIAAELASLFPVMERLCLAACPSCETVCCRRALVWFDFRDLIFMHLAEIPVPETPLTAGRGETCRCLAADGCRLERRRRPFVCTWYLCPRQTRLLREDPAEHGRVATCLERVKQLRKDMETAFVSGCMACPNKPKGER